MPLYEYFCSDCRAKFSALRPMKQADAPIACENCEGEHTARVLSLFAAITGERAEEGTFGVGPSATAGGGCGCGGACSCGHSMN